MRKDIHNILDECLRELQTGRATLDECMAAHPTEAAVLRPLLQVAEEVCLVEKPQARLVAFEMGKRRMLAALAERQRGQLRRTQPLFRRVADGVSLFTQQSRLGMREGRPVLRMAVAAAALLLVLLTPGLVSQSLRGIVVGREAVLVEAVGLVEIQVGGGTEWQSAVSGQVIVAGDRIRTGESSAATLSFFDGSTTSVGSRGEVAVSQLASRRDGFAEVIVLQQWAGQTYNTVRALPDAASRFRVETPTAVAAVLGTEFSIEVGADGGTEVMVVEGLVEVAGNGDVILVSAGQVATVEPPQPMAAGSGQEGEQGLGLGKWEGGERPGRGVRPPQAVHPVQPDLPEDPDDTGGTDGRERPEHPEHPEHPLGKDKDK